MCDASYAHAHIVNMNTQSPSQEALDLTFTLVCVYPLETMHRQTITQDATA